MKRNVLLVMPAADRDEMLQVAADGGFEFDSVLTCGGARRALRTGHNYDVVVTDLTLCDGNWWSVYQDMTVTGEAAEIIVIVPRKAVNVTEILAHGVHTVLAQPLDRDEVLRALESAISREPEPVGATAVESASAAGTG